MSFQDNSTNGGSITLLYVEAAKQNEVENGSDPKKLVKSFDACPIQFTSLRGSFSSVLIQYSSTMTLGLTKHKTRCGGRTSGCTKSWKNGAACIRRRPGNARSPAKQWEQRSSTTTTADSTTWTTLWTPLAPPSDLIDPSSSPSWRRRRRWHRSHSSSSGGGGGGSSSSSSSRRCWRASVGLLATGAARRREGSGGRPPPARGPGLCSLV